MCPESVEPVKRDRAFHFLLIEAKGARTQNANWIAHRQNFNTASQALHNIYYFVEMAGTLAAFYEKVRFYSIVATDLVFHVRVHRARELKEHRIQQDYPLEFLYDVVYDHRGGGYTKAETTAIVKNILIDYGIKVLKPLLVQTMKKVLEKRDQISVRNELLKNLMREDDK